MTEGSAALTELRAKIPDIIIQEQKCADGVPTAWISKEHIHKALSWLKNSNANPYSLLFDLTAVDERERRIHPDGPKRDFTLVYTLLSFDRAEWLRLKVPLEGEYPSVDSVTSIFPNANWYEREVWDMFGISFENHPFLERILNPHDWVGHPLRKEHPARATEMPVFELTEEKVESDEEALRFDPERFGLPVSEGDVEYLFLNLGPHHPGTHGLLRAVLQLDGEVIRDSVMEIGFHHRGAEKMAERQTFHTFIPYTDRIDYLSGLQNNLPYVLSVEKLAGIDVPPRAQVIRVMLCELWRIANHLVWFGTFAADVGAFSPVFFTFNDRERIFEIMEAICGFRMHPAWFRIGGVAHDLPNGWKQLVDNFLSYFPARIKEYEDMVVRNNIFKSRTKGIGVYTKESAVEWGVTGPNLRSTGVDWDLRKKRPYSMYDQFEFEVPVMDEGDSYARCLVRLEEMRQSLRIVRQAAENIPDGPYKSSHPLAMPPRKEETMEAIETLINHFLSVSWGQPVPPGEAMVPTEAPKGNYAYYVISDGGCHPYRCRIRTPSFTHIQSVPMLTKGLLVSDLLAILGSIDFVLADVDR